MTPLIVLGLVPLLLSVALYLGAPWAARRCAPQATARAMVVLGLCAALSSGVVLCAVACLGVSQLPGFARHGDWSAASLERQDPVPAVAAVLVTAVAAGLILASVVQVVRTVRRIAATTSDAQALGPAVNGITIVDDDSLSAYAVPSVPLRPGRTVVSRSVLRLLDPPERRALLAHEASHLRHHHVLLVQLAELSAAANPLLRPACAAVRAAVEQWADEDAAQAVGDPIPVARALAKTALARASSTGAALTVSPLVLGMAAETEVAGRVRALTQRRDDATGRLVTLMAVAAIVCAVSGSTVAVGAWDAFQRAEASFAQLHH